MTFPRMLTQVTFPKIKKYDTRSKRDVSSANNRVTLEEEQGWVPSTNIVAHNLLKLHFHGFGCPLLQALYV